MEREKLQVMHILQKHKGPVSAVTFSPDDRTLATSSWDQTTCLWEVNTGKFRETLRGQPNMVTSATFSPDGKRLATASQPEVRVWDLPTHPKTWPTIMTVPSISSLALAPDEQTLVVRDGLQHIACWQYPSGKKLPELPLPVRHGQRQLLDYRSFAFSSDGFLLAVAQAHEVTLWDRRTRQRISLQGDTFGVLAFSHDSRRLATNNLANNEVSLWDVHTGRRLCHWKANRNDVLTLAFSPDGNWLVTGSWDHELMVWDMTTAKPTPSLAQTIHGHEAPYIVPLSPRTAKPSSPQTMTKRSSSGRFLPSGKMVSLPAPDNIRTLIFLKDGKTLIAGGAKGSVYTWEVPSWQEIQAKH